MEAGGDHSVQQSDEIPHEEWNMLLENLIDDKDIRNILMSAFEARVNMFTCDNTVWYNGTSMASIPIDCCITFIRL